MIWVMLTASLLVLAVLFLCYAASVENGPWVQTRRVLLGRDRARRPR